MRDHTKLRAFDLADQLALIVYRVTASFPPAERFGLIGQMRRAAVSIPSNIVEGCARSTEQEYLRYLDIAYGSSRELQYQASLAARLGFLKEDSYAQLAQTCEETGRVLNGLINAFRRKHR
ncbi:MAG: four helix bundle protein [Phycisphaerae bacterium]|nr:four helix bundle protein [Phycisphaerae bacterium]